MLSAVEVEGLGEALHRIITPFIVFPKPPLTTTQNIQYVWVTFLVLKHLCCMNNNEEQMFIRAEINALSLIDKHLGILRKSSNLPLGVDFEIALVNAENEAVQRVNKDAKYCATNNFPNSSNETAQWFMQNLRINYKTYLLKKAKIYKLKEKVELTKEEQIHLEFYAGLADFHLKNEIKSQ
ncbi:MAG: hypothetical protein R2797_07775 [Gelidibacter sp.]